MKRYKNEPKTMTHHDYKECWNFLYKSGMNEDNIPKIGIEAWRKAKDRGFVESKEWGYIPGEKRRIQERRNRTIKYAAAFILGLLAIVFFSRLFTF